MVIFIAIVFIAIVTAWGIWTFLVPSYGMCVGLHA
jgi:hypothetical protein